MLKTKIKINKVSNLTDARYFAAAGVDYLGFCCNLGTERYCAPSRIKEIIDWVEGPAFVLEMDGWQSEEDIMSLLELKIGNALHFGIVATYDRPFPTVIFKDFILENISANGLENCDYAVLRSDKYFHQFSKTEKNELKDILNVKESFLDINFKNDDIDQMLEELPCIGLILRGGEEEKVGFKSFDELDEIFECLSN